MSYVSILKQHAAAAAGGAVQSMMFICGGVVRCMGPACAPPSLRVLGPGTAGRG